MAASDPIAPPRRALAYLEEELEALQRQDLLRTALHSGDALVLCANDYLGYAREPFGASDTLVGAHASGAGASRLVSGEYEAHAVLERTLADWVGLEDALVFSSGYAANVGTLAALATSDDVIVSDALNHASIIDGCRLSRARVTVTPHLDLGAVERALAASQSARRRFVVTEAYFSMDGDVPALAELRRLCDSFDAALVVDEAHSLGIVGPRGAGACKEAGIVPDVLVGTLGKSVGLQGAFVAGAKPLKAWLWNRARSFVFSTGVSPWLSAMTERRVRRVIADDAGRARLDAIVGRVRAELAAAGAPLVPSQGPIVPWFVGDQRRAIDLRDRLLDQGLFVQAIRPPTVPVGTSRLRITLHALLSDADVAFTVERLLAVLPLGGR